VPGVVVAYLSGRIMEALLAGEEPPDAPTLIAAVAMCVVMTILGGLVPALRALRIDPITALRAD
jgi:ABC-type antimicrobial peptide transport system permease subunit